jgi:hypothetical protein
MGITFEIEDMSFLEEKQHGILCTVDDMSIKTFGTALGRGAPVKEPNQEEASVSPPDEAATVEDSGRVAD